MSAKKPQKTQLRKYIEAQSAAIGDPWPFGRKNPVLVQLAKKSKLSAEAVYRVARGDYNLSPKNASALSKATGGEVSASKLAGLP